MTGRRRHEALSELGIFALAYVVYFGVRAFTEGTAAVGRALATSAPVHTVVVRSTVPPGTSDELVRPVLERESGKTAGTGFELASNPEFLRAATAVEDFRNPWMTVIASRHPQTIARMRELLAPFGGEIRTFSEPASAELVKCAHNIYNAAKISFWNEMWLVAQRIGVDLDAVSSTVAECRKSRSSASVISGATIVSAPPSPTIDGSEIATLPMS